MCPGSGLLWLSRECSGVQLLTAPSAQNESNIRTMERTEALDLRPDFQLGVKWSEIVGWKADTDTFH